jgi:predicted permease
MWTLGIYMFTREEKRKKIDNLKNLINPNTIAFFIGIMMLLLNIHLPDFLFGPLEGLGKTTIYLAMLYTGAILAYINIKEIVRDVTTFLLSFNKLLLAPILLIFLMKAIFLIFPIDLNATAKTVIVLEAAMPCQTLMIILARQFDKDDFYATQNFSVSTLLSIITLPIIYYLTQLMF